MSKPKFLSKVLGSFWNSILRQFKPVLFLLFSVCIYLSCPSVHIWFCAWQWNHPDCCLYYDSSFQNQWIQFWSTSCHALSVFFLSCLARTEIDIFLMYRFYRQECLQYLHNLSERLTNIEITDIQAYGDRNLFVKVQPVVSGVCNFLAMCNPVHSVTFMQMIKEGRFPFDNLVVKIFEDLVKCHTKIIQKKICNKLM